MNKNFNHKVEITEVEEYEDGSAKITFEADAEVINILAGYGLSLLIESLATDTTNDTETTENEE